MRWPALRSALLETAKLTVMIFALIWGVLIFVRFLGFAGLPEAFASWLVNLPLPAVVTMILILLGYAVLGMFMDAIGMLLLTLPVVYPAVIALGYDPIWFGIIVVKMCEVCLITPARRPQLLRGGRGAAGHSAGRGLPGDPPLLPRGCGDRRPLPRLSRDRALAAQSGKQLRSRRQR